MVFWKVLPVPVRHCACSAPAWHGSNPRRPRSQIISTTWRRIWTRRKRLRTPSSRISSINSTRLQDLMAESLVGVTRWSLMLMLCVFMFVCHLSSLLIDYTITRLKIETILILCLLLSYCRSADVLKIMILLIIGFLYTVQAFTCAKYLRVFDRFASLVLRPLLRFLLRLRSSACYRTPSLQPKYQTIGVNYTAS